MDASLDYKPTNEDILILREWMEKMPHLIQDLTDYELSAFIKAAKGRLQKVKVWLEKNNELGYRYPKFLGHLDPLNKTFQDFLNAIFSFPMPTKTEDGATVIWMIARNDPDVDLSNYNWEEIMRYWVIGLMVMVWEKMEGNTKLIVIYDCSNSKFARYKNITATSVRDWFQIFQSSPIRLKGVYLINLPSFAAPIINFAKSAMKTKILKRIYFQSNLETLHETVPTKCIPREYGGCGESVRVLHDSWRKTIESYRDKLIETNGKMRKLDPLRPKLEEHDQELEGTFRQLVVD